MSEKIEEIRENRIAKLKKFREKGINPYPVKSKRTHTVGDALRLFKKHGTRNTEHVTLVGRIRSIRVHGKLTFGDLEDGTGNIQFMLRADDLTKDQYKDFGSLFDMGDFIQITGKLILSKTKEKTLEVKSFTILTKSLLPVPDDFYGLKDTETKLRKRYLDLMTSKDTKELFRKKSVFWQAIREFLIERGFMEVDLNVLEEIPGGAEAEPFITHHNSLDRDFYLRISLELPHKKLLVGGLEKIFEIGRIFRNEGISTEHLQDYTQLEFYQAYSDYEKLMDMSEKMYQDVIKAVTGGLKTSFKGKTVNWAGKWPRMDYFQLFKKNTGIDLNKTDEKTIKAYAKKEKILFEKNAGKGRVIDLIFKKKIRLKLWDPSFLINPPIEIEPLAKKNPENNKQVQRMQIMACGTELGKGFSELNDPLDQRERFEEQMKLREQGDTEAQMMDEGFVEALEYGMPPACGFGLSERLFAVIMDKSIRETQFAPPMKESDLA
jgi:lysyl-tRNA synthetase, class II